MNRKQIEELYQRMAHHTYIAIDSQWSDLAVVVLTAKELEELLVMADFYLNTQEAHKP